MVPITSFHPQHSTFSSHPRFLLKKFIYLSPDELWTFRLPLLLCRCCILLDSVRFTPFRATRTFPSASPVLFFSPVFFFIWRGCHELVISGSGVVLSWPSSQLSSLRATRPGHFPVKKSPHVYGPFPGRPSTRPGRSFSLIFFPSSVFFSFFLSELACRR